MTAAHIGWLVFAIWMIAFWAGFGTAFLIYNPDLKR
jgi:hypothetical protein